MKIQLALDRMTVEEAIEMTRQVEDYVDWVEVGTSLIKEFGTSSIRALKEAFPNKIIVADIKTIDNAKYEFQLCFEAGADLATVMGVAPPVTIETCLHMAAQYDKRVMVDLLNTNEEHIQQLRQYDAAIFCAHVSKDQQEIAGKQTSAHAGIPKSLSAEWAVAGGISLESLDILAKLSPTVVIIGSAITKAANPKAAAKQIKEYILSIEERAHA
ncbi:3-hexulose-6-phosphate synthase [Bacillus sp. OTU530]|uniref:3-hexulose-6-phosphate synthase n=1 Tax=Bacillus sp. OTU530 TaxID=3043862 RepID=UPI00313D4A45